MACLENEIALDYPGYGNNEQDDRANRYEDVVDVVIFISTFTGFLESSDLRWLSLVIKTLPPFELIEPDFTSLSNLFVLASHINTKHQEKVKQAFKKAARRRYPDLEFAFREREELTGRSIEEEDFCNMLHSFYYDEDRDSVSGSFFHDLQNILCNELPNIIIKRFESELERLKKTCVKEFSQKIEACQNQIKQLNQLEAAYNKCLADEPKRKSEVAQKKTTVENYIKQQKRQSISEFRTIFYNLTNESNLENKIKSRYDNEKEAEEYAMGYVLEEAEYEIKSILKPKTEEVIAKTEAFLADYQAYGSKYSVGTMSSFLINAGKQFTIGITTGGVTGAFTSFALASAGSLLAANTSGILAVLGGAMAHVGAALGGLIAHVIFPVGLLAAVGLGFARLFRGPWQRVVAKKIIKAIEEKNIENKLVSTIEKYWDDTLAAFRNGVDKVEEAWHSNLKRIKYQVEHPEKGLQDIEAQIEQLEAARIFFMNLH